MGIYPFSFYLLIMPNLDGTGPLGNGPKTGRGLGRNMNKGTRMSRKVRNLGGTKECTCPNCSYKEQHQRGIPCSEKKCPKCGTPMSGAFCL
jgi:hypothetical protein